MQYGLKTSHSGQKISSGGQKISRGIVENQ